MLSFPQRPVEEGCKCVFQSTKVDIPEFKNLPSLGHSCSLPIPFLHTHQHFSGGLCPRNHHPRGDSIHFAHTRTSCTSLWQFLNWIHSPVYVCCVPCFFYTGNRFSEGRDRTLFSAQSIWHSAVQVTGIGKFPSECLGYMLPTYKKCRVAWADRDGMWTFIDFQAQILLTLIVARRFVSFWPLP